MEAWQGRLSLLDMLSMALIGTATPQLDRLPFNAVVFDILLCPFNYSNRALKLLRLLWWIRY